MLANATLRTLALLSVFSLLTTVSVAQQPGSGVPAVPGDSPVGKEHQSPQSNDFGTEQSLPVLDMTEPDEPVDSLQYDAVYGEPAEPSQQWNSVYDDSAVNEPHFESPATPDQVLNSYECFAETDDSSGCCYNYCCDPCRTWTFRAGAIFLHRSRPDSQTLFSDPSGSGMNARGFNPGWATGVDVNLIRHRAFGTNNDLELRYFGIDNWTDSQSLRLNGTPVTIQNNPPTSIAGGRDVNSQYSSSLLNTELNMRRRVGNNWTFIGGLRYLQFNEQLNSQLTNGPAPGDHHYNVAALNDLFGVQAGLMYDLCSSCDCCVQLYGKAGLYANHAAQHTALNCFCAPPMSFSANGSTTQAASVGELGINGSKRIWKNLALRGGYQVLILDGVATAPGQFPVTNLVSQSGLGNNDTVVFHGATIGLELTY